MGIIEDLKFRKERGYTRSVYNDSLTVFLAMSEDLETLHSEYDALIDKQECAIKDIIQDLNDSSFFYNGLNVIKEDDIIGVIVRAFKNHLK